MGLCDLIYSVWNPIKNDTSRETSLAINQGMQYKSNRNEKNINYKSTSGIVEGFDGMLGPTQTNVLNQQDEAQHRMMEDKFNNSLSDYARAQKNLMDKTQTYIQNTASTNQRNKNIYVTQSQSTNDIHPKWKGCYAGGKGLIHQEDMGNSATQSACKTRASDLGYSNFSLGSGKCYVGNLDEGNMPAYKSVVSYAFKPNKEATMGGLLKNGQIGTFNNKTTLANLVTDLPAVAGCDAQLGGLINARNTVASYGANCNVPAPPPKTVREQLSELCPPDKTNPTILKSMYPGLNYNYDTYMFGACTAAGTCDTTTPDDISKELLDGIKANKKCNWLRFNDGNYIYYDGGKIPGLNSFYDPSRPEGWAKTDCKKFWYDSGAPHMQWGCMQNLWQEAGCTTNMHEADKTLREKYFTLNATDIRKSMKTIATATDSDNRFKCYGADKSKWPSVAEDCSKYTDDDANIPYTCFLEKWKKYGSTTDVKERLDGYYNSIPEKQRRMPKDDFINYFLNLSVNNFKSYIDTQIVNNDEYINTPNNDPNTIQALKRANMILQILRDRKT